MTNRADRNSLVLEACEQLLALTDEVVRLRTENAQLRAEIYSHREVCTDVQWENDE